MTYQATNAVYALRSYLWKLLEANLGWSKNSYEGKTPIIPLSQQPELMQSGNAFIVYGSALHPAQFLDVLNTETISFTVYSKSPTEVDNIVNLLYEAFKRQDLAAQDVNEWLDTENAGRNVRFTYIRSILVEKATPADEEGGFNSAMIMVQTGHVALDTNIITRGFTAD